MTEIVIQSPSNLPSSPRLPPPNDGLHQQPLFNSPNTYSSDSYRIDTERDREERDREGDQLSLLEALVTVFRKSSFLIACRSNIQRVDSMEIGLPTDVRHVAHVTFDRFDGFLGLPVEFEPEVPRRPPSASTRVFGVSTDSMQLSFDSRGNSVPTILLMMQRRLYEQGGLQAEGIFRITAGNSQEEYVREQLNSGVVPENIDVHCLAGLIKAWFRELPNGVLDSIPAEDVMQAQSEEECAQLVKRLPQTEAALLDWALNLMADVSQLESHNKMNARNIAMVFAPNMTQMADPLTALMYAVQVMNFLKTLIEKTLRERSDSILEQYHSQTGPYDDNNHHSYPQPMLDSITEDNEEEQIFLTNEPSQKSPSRNIKPENEAQKLLSSIENIITEENNACLAANQALINMLEASDNSRLNKGLRNKKKSGPMSNSNIKRIAKRASAQAGVRVEKSKGTSLISRLNSGAERVEAWR